ncbi:hypothetical protein [Aquimarina spongiae]|uniref:hypothetical protein n=1 Tax=Aquimarina spongiae TaxID=570521 RepID=UPI001481809F|nr:hypothetical protein [Aquimarina spongiae]
MKKNKIRTNKINSAYVFAEDDKVYLKCHPGDQSRSSNFIHSSEWIPISFCWES